MGGKSKQNQRTKNNARPSSSGRSSEFLGSNSHIFAGFSTSESLLVKSSLQGVPNVDLVLDESTSGLDPTVIVVLRKLTKKDSVTKSKALKELNQLIGESEDTAVKAILPLWPRLYQNLATEVDHKVRENCQQVHRALVTKMGKQIAPFLKQIAPTWVASQYDTYAPAGSCARSSFQTAFPDRKMKELISFCHDEILDYIFKTLTGQMNTQNEKNYTPEEFEARSLRAIFSALNSYSFYIENAGEDNFKAKLEKQEALINNGKFWTYSKHTSNQIRASWFEAISHLLDKFPLLLENHQQKVVNSVIQNLDDSDPMVLSFVWSCLLLVQSNISNWIQYVNIEKAFLVKLRSVLSDCPSSIHTHLLPFVSKIDSKTLGKDTERFLVELFESMATAIKKSKVAQRQEIKSLTNTFFECLQFVITKLRSADSNDFLPAELSSSFCDRTIDRHVLGMLKWTLIENPSFGPFIYPKIGMIIEFWKNNSYKDFLDSFWIKLTAIVRESLEPIENQDVRTVLDSQLTMLTLLPLRKQEVKQPKKVNFGEVPPEGKIFKQDAKEKNNWPELTDLALIICELYFWQVIDKKQGIYLKYLLRLVKEFDDASLEKRIFELKSYGDLEKEFINWLQDNKTSQNDVISLLLHLSRSQTESKKMKLIETLLNLKDDNIQHWTLNQIMKGDNDIKTKVLQMTPTKTYLDHCALKLVNGVSAVANYNLLKMYFEQMKFLKLDHFENIVEILCNSLASDFYSQLCSDLVIELFHLLPKESSKLKLKIFYILFGLGFNPITDKEQVEKIRTTWIQGFETGDVCIDESLLGTCNDVMVQRFNADISGDQIRVDAIADSLCELILFESKQSPKSETRAKLVCYFPKLQALSRYMQFLSLYLDNLSGNILTHNLPTLKNNIEEEHNYGIKYAFKAAELNCLVLTRVLKQVENQNEFLDQIVDLMVVCTCGEVLDSYNVEDAEAEDIINEYLDLFKELVDVLNNQTKTEVLAELKRNANDRGGIWPQCWVNFAKLTAINFETEIKYEEYPVQKMTEWVQVLLPVIAPKSLSLETAAEGCGFDKLTEKCLYEACMIKNHFNSDYNEMADNAKIKHSIMLLEEIIVAVQAKKLNLLYNSDLKGINHENIGMVTTVARLCRLMVVHFNSELNTSHWDFIRIALSSWTLTVSKAVPLINDNPHVPVFMNSVLDLFKSVMDLFEEKAKLSSTQAFSKVVEEWNSIFAKEVNVVLTKVVYSVINTVADKHVLAQICPKFSSINFAYLFMMNRIDKQISLNDFVGFVLRNVSQSDQARHYLAMLFKKLVPGLIEIDKEALAKKSDSDQVNHWHCLEFYFTAILDSEFGSVNDLLADFSFKPTDEVAGNVPRNQTVAYLLLWDCMLNICSNSTPELRSIYANWITKSGRDQTVLKMIFKLLPDDVIKNFETKSPKTEQIFRSIDNLDLSDKNLSTECLACYTYLNLVRFLPAVVRKWWSNLPHRPKLIVEKFNTFHVSQLLCQEEMLSLVEKRDRMDNMQISVHNSTREINAVYSIDEARMELLITLPVNYPLGVVKVDCGKQIGGRIQSRVVVMQLTLFLGHQNGNLWDGLSLWKKNLDKKFDGVEECYVCYSVIHQDTCQLPKLTCKACRKKFHSPCLYRWFSTSNKSTCPICRNVF